MAYQSLYRRYRSARFDELVGQQHVVTALKNAITEDRVGHAYLFSGPRGTGKTSTARILAKALNCTNLADDGEPCGECDSCVAFDAGTSYDLQELDAASNNGVEAIRELISRVALGTPGRTKVYILDEVHMLSSGAENALLKTLEEPPDHVVFVLATTEPHKVVPTIRSRTQHYEFELIPAAELEQHVRFIVEDAALDVDDSMIDYALRAGGGSARDTLSALDQVVAAGAVLGSGDSVDEILAGVAASDAGLVMVAAAAAFDAGREPRVVGEQLLELLRDAFLSAMGAPLAHLSETQAASAREVAANMGPAAITRSLELIGSALVDMRQAPDPRIDLEVALLRLTKPELDTDLSAILTRLERLEAGSSSAGSAPPAPQASDSSTQDATSATTAEPRDPEPVHSGSMKPADAARAELARAGQSNTSGTSGAAPPDKSQNETPSDPAPATPPKQAKQTLGAARNARRATSDSSDVPPDAAPAPEATATESEGNSVGGALSVEALNGVWDQVKAGLPGRAKSRFSGGRFVSIEGSAVRFGLPNAIHRDRCQECAEDVRAALAEHLGVEVGLELVVDDNAPVPPARGGQVAEKTMPAEPSVEEVVDLEGLTDADEAAVGGVDLLAEAFPGAEVMEPDTGA